MHSNAHVIRDVVIAAVVGTTVGTAAGLWTQYDAAAAPTPVKAAIAPHPTSVSTGVGPAAADKPPVRTEPIPVPTKAAEATTEATMPAADAEAQPGPPPPRSSIAAAPERDLQRARALAHRADVNALIVLRDHVARRAEERGELESPAIKHQLEELDQYLADARALRLLLDAEEFRKAAADSNRPR